VRFLGLFLMYSFQYILQIYQFRQREDGTDSLWLGIYFYFPVFSRMGIHLGPLWAETGLASISLS